MLDKKFAKGITSKDIIALFEKKGARMSEATLRKYVQLGLLPRSVRVGGRGPHSGSRGLYPVSVIRQINDIKAALEAGASLEGLRQGPLVFRHRLLAFRAEGAALVEGLRRAATSRQPKASAKVNRALAPRQKALLAEIDRLSSAAQDVWPS